jgi:4-hydroxy-2-oxoheptanedioate aldolase
MMCNVNFVGKKLASGQPVLGIWSIINSPMVSEIAASSGLDFQILDMEHGVFDVASLDHSIRACESAGCSPLVRVAGLQPAAIQTCLDLGAHGIIVPQVKDHRSAAEVVMATRYSPGGIRGFNPFTRAGGYAGVINDTTPKLKDGFGLTSIIVENRSAYDDLDRILEVPGLDLVYLGVYDMSVALGCAGDTKHPAISRFVESSIPRIRKASKAAGLMVTDLRELPKYLDLGANFIVYGVDSFIIREAMGAAVSGFSKSRAAQVPQ